MLSKILSKSQFVISGLDARALLKHLLCNLSSLPMFTKQLWCFPDIELDYILIKRNCHAEENVQKAFLSSPGNLFMAHTSIISSPFPRYCARRDTATRFDLFASVQLCLESEYTYLGSIHKLNKPASS